MNRTDDHDTLPPSQDPAVAAGVEEPPRDVLGTLKRLGPGLIIAGSIVGSGELIATTKTGAQAGIALLWLIVIGCLIKVFAQIELGRFAIGHGETTLAALDQVPGPRYRVNWILWFWAVMTCCTIGQLGGIVGGVGQAAALAMPLNGDYVDAIRMPSAGDLKRYATWESALTSEWDVRLYLAQRNNGASETGVDSESASDTDSASAGETLDAVRNNWMHEVADRVEARLEKLGPAAGEPGGEIVAAVERVLEAERVLDASDAGPLEALKNLEVAREKLAVVLAKANLTFINNDDATGDASDEDSPMAKLRKMDEKRLKRRLRGHTILSGRLADVDDDSGRASRAMAAVLLLTEADADLNRAQSHLHQMEKPDFKPTPSAGDLDAARTRIAIEEGRVSGRKAVVDALVEPHTWDDKIWAAIVALVTSLVLWRGRYNLIQTIATVLVVSFTFVTIGNVISLQTTQQWHISASEMLRGMMFRPPEADPGKNPWVTALATFGIIGVGASELIAYPYWCLEKGYAKFTGRATSDAAWARRANGWLRVMRWDAFVSMIVYTVATLAFFLMGVAVLYNDGLDPDGMRMVSTLAEAYVPVFGEYAKWLFLAGAVAVLYSTFLVANAGNARMVTDAFKVFNLMDRHSERAHERALSALSVILPLLCLAVFLSGANPVRLILIAGGMQAFMLPIIGFAALYFRYRRTDERIKPSPVWDVMLVVSFAGLFIAGAWGVWKQVEKVL